MPLKSVYRIGERIVCWANGKPAPAYEWMEIGTNRTISGSLFIIDDSFWSNKTHQFRCTAYNTVAGVRNQIYKTITFTAEGTDDFKQSRIETLLYILFYNTNSII